LDKEGLQQNVHNIIIAEEGSELHIITGCSTSPHMKKESMWGSPSSSSRKRQTQLHHDPQLAEDMWSDLVPWLVWKREACFSTTTSA